MTELRADCGIDGHEWVPCRSCRQSPHEPCPCAGGRCCRREIDEERDEE